MKYPRTVYLETKRLVLRPLALDDFEAVHSWAGNPENVRYMAWGPNNEEQTGTFLASVKPGKDFAIVLTDSNTVIGSCGIYPDADNDTGELGWILHQDYWKHGYGTELAGELIRYGFEELKLRRIFAPCAAVNYGSYRIMERNGMRREALHHKAFWARVDKEWIDKAIYAILAEDYFARNTGTFFDVRSIEICSMRDKPEYLDRAVDYFSAKWSAPRAVYQDCISNSIKTESPLPRWYLLINNPGMIIGSYGLVVNDFNSRQDLWPWLCALYVEESFRGHAIGAKMLAHGKREAKLLGLDKLYLCTDHIGYYEKYGWWYIGDGYDTDGRPTRIYEINTE